MTKKGRRIFFYILVLIFIIAGTLSVRYAQGYRLDLSTFKVTKVGAIFVRSYPSDSDIFLDGEPIKNKSGLLSSGTLINDLFPKKYRLELRMTGYKNFDRTVEVKPSLVSEFKYSVLVPDKSTLVVSAPAKNFWLLTNTLIQDSQDNLRIADSKLPGKSVEDWRSDFSQVLTFDPKSLSYYSTDLKNATSTNVTSEFKALGGKPSNSTKVSFDPDNNFQYVISSPSSISILDTQKNTLTTIAQASTTANQIFSDSATSRFWIALSTFSKAEDTTGLMTYDKFFGDLRKLDKAIPGRTTNMKWLDNNLLGFSQDNGDLYIYRPSDNSLQKVASDAKDFEYNPNTTNLAALEKTSLEVFSLSDSREYWRFNLPDAQKIEGVKWYKDGMHLFIVYPDRTMFLGLDDKFAENLIKLSDTDKIQYNPSTNQFYYLDNQKINRIDLPQ